MSKEKKHVKSDLDQQFSILILSGRQAADSAAAAMPVNWFLFCTERGERERERVLTHGAEVDLYVVTIGEHTVLGIIQYCLK